MYGLYYVQVTASVKRNLTCSAGLVRTLQVFPHSILEVEEKLGHATNTKVLKSGPFFRPQAGRRPRWTLLKLTN